MSATPRERPSILVITTHDTGRFLGCYGVGTVHSPAIDRLASEGVRFTRYHGTGVVCSPSRCSMMTGLYPQTHGMVSLAHRPCEMRPTVRHLAYLLRENGYRTVLFRFQHETMELDRLGFHEYRAMERCFVSESVPDEVAMTAPRVAEEVVAFFDEHQRRRRGTPFYAQVGFFETHTPFTYGGVTPDTARGVTVLPHIEDNQAARDYFAHLQGQVRQADMAVGTILEGLQAAGLERDTLVVFAVDHGVECPRAKQTLHDAGTGIAHIVRWPGGGVPSGTECGEMVSNVDFTPTVLELAGVAAPARLQGESYARVLRAPETTPHREAVYGYSLGNQARCVRTKRHALIVNFAPQFAYRFPVDLNRREKETAPPFIEFYDLQRDPHEGTNAALNPEYRTTIAAMARMLVSWMESVNDAVVYDRETHAECRGTYYRLMQIVNRHDFMCLGKRGIC